MNALMLRRQAMMAGGKSEPPKLFLTATSADTIVIPISLPQSTVKKTVITADCYLNPVGASNYYAYSNHPGNTDDSGRPLLCRATGNKLLYYPRGSAYSDPALVAAIKSYTIDYPNSTFELTSTGGTTKSASWAGQWYDTAAYLKSPYDMSLKLSTYAYWHSIEATVDGVITHRLVAKQDGDGTPCMQDEITGDYYYPANGSTATLVAQPY